LVDFLIVPGEFDDAAFGGEIAAQDGDGAARFEGFAEVLDDLLAGGFDGFGGLFGEGASGDGEGRAIDVAGFEQSMGDDGDAAGFIDIGGHEFAARFDIDDDGGCGRGWAQSHRW